MSLIPWRPFWDIDKWFDEEPLLGENFSTTPKMDIYKTKKNVVAEIELPGINPENIKVEVENNALRIEAEKEEKKEEKEKDYYRREISSSSYKRIIPLPVEVIEDKAEASYEDGVLKVLIPRMKEEKNKNKKIQIKIKNKRSKK